MQLKKQTFKSEKLTLKHGPLSGYINYKCAPYTKKVEKIQTYFSGDSEHHVEKAEPKCEDTRKHEGKQKC